MGWVGPFPVAPAGHQLLQASLSLKALVSDSAHHEAKEHPFLEKQPKFQQMSFHFTGGWQS